MTKLATAINPKNRQRFEFLKLMILGISSSRWLYY